MKDFPIYTPTSLQERLLNNPSLNPSRSPTYRLYGRANTALSLHIVVIEFFLSKPLLIRKYVKSIKNQFLKYFLLTEINLKYLRTLLYRTFITLTLNLLDPIDYFQEFSLKVLIVKSL